MFSDPQGQTDSSGVKTAHIQQGCESLKLFKSRQNPDLVTFQRVRENVSLSAESPGVHQRRGFHILTTLSLNTHNTKTPTNRPGQMNCREGGGFTTAGM